MSALQDPPEPEPKFPAPDPDPEREPPGPSPVPVHEPVEPGPDVIDPGLEPANLTGERERERQEELVLRLPSRRTCAIFDALQAPRGRGLHGLYGLPQSQFPLL